jgi:hypothetical protein
LRQQRRFNILVAGRRWRKTSLVTNIAVHKALAGETILWAAPTYDQVYIGWENTKAAKGTYPIKFTVRRMVADFPTGGRIIYRSLDDPDNARGHSADGIVIDESGDIKDAAFETVLRPILAEGGWLWAIGTPRGRNWFYYEFKDAKKRDDSISWQVPLLGAEIVNDKLIRKPHLLENPYFSWDELQKAYKASTEKIFRQEYLADFVQFEGAVFRNIKACVKAIRQTEAIENHRYVFGVDWGKSDDFTVITVLDVNTKSCVHLDRFNQISYLTQARRLKSLYDKFKPLTIIAEKNAMGEPIIEQLVADGLPVEPFTTTAPSKKRIIEGLQLALEKNDIKILNDEILIEELEAYEAQTLGGGTIRYGAPSRGHDDCVMSLALAWSGVEERQPVIFSTERIIKFK